MGAQPRRIQIARTVNETVAVDMRESNFDGPIDAIFELGKNANDCDAPNWWITHSEEDTGRLVIEDDGDGMKDGAGLEAFFKPGGSESRERRSRGEKTKKGRNEHSRKIWVGRLGNWVSCP